MSTKQLNTNSIFKQWMLGILLLSLNIISFAKDSLAVKLPQSVFLQLINTTQKFDINHATEFKHVDVPKSYYNSFLSYIKDSVAAEIPELKSFVYYSFTLKNGAILNGDIYWNDQLSYIVFKIDEKKYVNYFTKEGVVQLKTIFKL
jgi:hypothetical protein